MTLTQSQKQLVNQKVEHWLARLLDLSGRNRLLYFKETRTTTIEVTFPAPFDLFSRLVDKGGSFIFPLADDLPLTDIAEEEKETAPVKHVYRDNEIGSADTPSVLARKLYNLLTRSKTAREEQGVNILFIGFGFLQWRDTLHGELARSPLVLVPVDLTREAPGKPYQLAMLDDDLVVNPTLQEALRQFYAIQLDDLPEDLDAAGLKTYLDQVAAQVAEQKDWAVDTRGVIDVFSYQKQIIVADLKQNAAVLKNHDLIASMSIPGLPLPQKDFNLVTADELDDKIPPQEVFQILDADSSQQEAIQAAKAGLSFVLQGPPGTGKSQTIANIIAEFLASGRHVLFVSAKMAALEVVQDRLKKADLGSFCLQVHSHKRNKREVIEELGQSLDSLPEVTPPVVNTHLETLQSTRVNLNAYVRALHAPQFGLGLSAFAAYSQLTRFKDAPELNFTLPKLTTLTPQDFEGLKDLTVQLAACEAVIAHFSAHPWYGFASDTLTVEQEAEIKNKLIELKSLVERFQGEMERNAAPYGLAFPANLDQANELFKLAKDYTPGVIQMPAVEMLERYKKNYLSIARFIRPQYWKDSALLARTSRIPGRVAPQKAVEDLTFIVKMQARRASPASSEQETGEAPAPDLQKARELESQVKAGIDYLTGLYQADRMPANVSGIATQPYAQVSDWLQKQAGQVNRLREWVDFLKLEHQAESKGIGAFVREALQIRLPGDQWLPGFLRRFYTLWIGTVANKEQPLGSFNSKVFEASIRKFQDLDKEHIRLAKLRIRERLLQNRPKAAWMSVASSEEAILRREINKKRRIKPLRRLFAEIPGLILRLRPCLMMSPLTVSQLLDTGLYHFDLVIFDEASQIHPEEAVGAIIRGQQAIIVGDRHQLPPTAFFEVLEADEDGEEESGAEDLESILNEGDAAGLPSKMLQWHYRSKDEALIAFSNHHFYNDKLLTFPASRQDNPETGVSFVPVSDGIYQRGGRRNLVEARKVVDLIIAHAQQHPDLSLGVVTFSQSQKDTIQLELDQRLRTRPELQDFFSDNAPEPAFVKNLELVQGDERDVMIFSIGYGRDESGKFILNFGPLNQEGGERRLNVAVTRARQKVILVSSIQPEDIDLSRTNSRGVKLLRNYMTLARDGIQTIYADLKVEENADFESPFEASVYDALTGCGLQLKKQVGVSGYRIDLAVIDAEQPGRFLLGIECDGAMYHAGKTARDRDRLRQDVLERLGWHIHRIWSCDWNEDQQKEVEKVLKAVKQIHKDPPGRERPPFTVPLTGASVKPRDEIVNIVKLQEPQNKLPEGAVFYKETPLPRQRNGIEGFYRTPSQRFNQWVGLVAQTEGPVEINLVVERVAKAWDMQRIGPKVRAKIEQAIHACRKANTIEVRDGFVWPKGLAGVPVRVPSGMIGIRDIDQICTEEVAEAAYLCLKAAISLDAPDLVRQTAWLYGLRANEKTEQKVKSAINLLIKAGKIEWREDKVRIPKE